VRPWWIWQVRVLLSVFFRQDRAGTRMQDMPFYFLNDFHTDCKQRNPLGSPFVFVSCRKLRNGRSAVVKSGSSLIVRHRQETEVTSRFSTLGGTTRPMLAAGTVSCLIWGDVLTMTRRYCVFNSFIDSYNSVCSTT
jgi:hypothetical protein